MFVDVFHFYSGFICLAILLIFFCIFFTFAIPRRPRTLRRRREYGRFDRILFTLLNFLAIFILINFEFECFTNINIYI